MKPEEEFCYWLNDAKPGEGFVYATGILGSASDSVKSVAKLVLQAASDGLVELVQKRRSHPTHAEDVGRFDYIAIKRRSKRRPWPPIEIPKDYLDPPQRKMEPLPLLSK